MPTSVCRVEQQVGVVLGIDADEGILPLDGGDGMGQSVLDVPENGTAEVDVFIRRMRASRGHHFLLL